MSGGWLVQDGPETTPAQALARLTDEPVLLMLHSGGHGWTYCCWGAPEVTPEAALASAAGAKGDGEQPESGAWSGGFGGGWFLQLDYEYPRSHARCWTVDAYLAWDPAGKLRLHARDRRGLARLVGGLVRPAQALPGARLVDALAPSWPAAGHHQRCAAIRDYIAAGDIYQANLTTAFTGRLAPGPGRDLALFLALTGAGPAPFAALLRTPARSIVSHSPECFLARVGDAVRSAPIKGTSRRRPGEEAAARARLLGSAKDRAELAMIVDLVRNDLGRVAAPGSVRVAEPARVLDLAYVHHLVAEVAAVLRPGTTLGELLAAAFPAGSITGAPKRRAMAIISELEARARGPYCGAFGWVGEDGSAQLAVAIRTVVVTGDEVVLAAGGGIVADSDPAAEWDELLAKAAPMAQGLGASL